MSQTESAPDVPSDSTEPAAPAKPPRNPVEKLIVWGVIAIGLVIVGIEARAKFGYDTTFSAISEKLVEVDNSGEVDAALTMDQALELAAFGPSLSEVVEVPPPEFGDLRTWQKKMNWFSLVKTYELTLVMDQQHNVLGIETPSPPEEEVAEPDESSDEDSAEPAGAEGMAGFGGGEMAAGPPEGHSGDPAQAGGGPGGGRGGSGPGGRGRGFGRPRGLAGLLSIEEVATELNLNDEQKTKIAELSETLQEEASGMRDIFGQMREADESERANLFEQLAKMRAQIDDKAKEALKDILNEEQMTRLLQIHWQQEGTVALASADVAEKLGLSEEQQQKLTELVEARGNELRELGFQGSAEERQAIQNSYDEKLVAVLTDEQKSSWASLQGEPFEMPAPSRGGQGGRRGGGGRPGAGGEGGSDRPQRPQRPE